MSPRRPLTDLCLMALFKQLEPKDQVKASRVNSRWAILVRAANRRVRTLVITNENYFKFVQHRINRFSLASTTSMQHLPNANEPLVGDYPMTTRVSKWNVLDTCDLPTTDELVTIFSAVTDLKFIIYFDGCKRDVQYLADLLCHPHWASQLTNLMSCVKPLLDRFTKDVVSRLFTAINSLSALEYLAIDFDVDNIPFPDLPILAQLKVIAVEPYEVEPFWRSLKRHAAANEQLQVHVLSFDANGPEMLSLSEPLHSRLVSAGETPTLDYINDNVPFLCSRFTSLITLSIGFIEASQVGPLFTALLQLPHLVHLGLHVNFTKNRSFEELPWSSRPQTQLKSVRALDLELIITSHFQVQWLNLQWTLPHLQAIHLKDFECQICCVSLCDGPDVNSASFSTARECLGESLLPHLVLMGVHPERIIFKVKFSSFISFAQL